MTQLAVQNMTCGHCRSAVERAILTLDPAARVTVDLPGGTIVVTGGATAPAIIAALAAEGYPATLTG